MNRRFLTGVVILACLTFSVGRVYAWNQTPIADINDSNTPYSQSVCVGETVVFDGSDSYDSDGYIVAWEWYVWVWIGYWEYVDTLSGEITSYDFDGIAGEYYIDLWVQDNDDEWCLWEDADWCYVDVVEVDNVVESGTMDPGPLYVCPNDTVDLEAKPYPVGASFPTGEPNWTIESQPSDANASLTDTSGSTTTTVDNLSVPGEYIVNARCCCVDLGDSITITVVKVEITYPDDTNGNGIIDDPENEFSFNTADPAVLQIWCTAFNSPGADADKFRWTIDNIGTIRGKWNPHVAGDEYTGKGLNPTVTFKGMPNNNSDFGGKTITLRYEGLSCTDTETIEVFFHPLAKNNTGPQPDDIPNTIDLKEVVIKKRQ